MFARSSDRGAGKSLLVPEMFICHLDVQNWRLLLEVNVIKS